MNRTISRPLVPEHAMGIDYALIAMFICLLIYQLNGSIYWLTAAMAGIIAVVLSVWIPGNAYIVLASLIAATAGTLVRYRGKKRGGQ